MLSAATQQKMPIPTKNEQHGHCTNRGLDRLCNINEAVKPSYTPTFQIL